MLYIYMNSVFIADDTNARYSVVASFIFLRFFAAALLSPRKYKLVNEDMVSRKLLKDGCIKLVLV